MSKILCFISLFLIAGVSASAAEVKLTVDNIENGGGNIMVGFCSGIEEFSEEKPAKSLSFIFPAKPGAITETVSVPEGSYAVIVYHDSNGDGTLNKGFMGKPLEKYGFSNNIFGPFGRKPAFEKALVVIGGEGGSIHISLR